MAGDADDAGACIPVFRKEEDETILQSIKQRTRNGILAILCSVGIMYLNSEWSGRKCSLGMELSSLGPFLNNQLLLQTVLNVIFLVVEMYRSSRGATVLHPGGPTAVIYSDFFTYRHPGPDGYPGQRLKEALDRGTVLILLEAVLKNYIFLYTVHRSRSHASIAQLGRILFYFLRMLAMLTLRIWLLANPCRGPRWHS